MAFYVDPDDDQTTLPYRRTVGMELEIAAGNASRWLYDNGHAPDAYLHDAHCDCYEQDAYPIHPTEDCTAYGGEYLIGGSCGVLAGSPLLWKATEVLEQAFLESNAESNDRVGGHVHVGYGDMRGDRSRKCVLLRNYLAYEEKFLELAAGPVKYVRSNGNCEPNLTAEWYLGRFPTEEAFWHADEAELYDKIGTNLPYRPTLNFSGHNGNTIEFRVWNSTRVQWRMMLATTVSSAFVEASALGWFAEPPGPDQPEIEWFLGDLLTADMVALIERQRTYNRKLPHTPRVRRGW